ncbi:MAG TPA: glycosyltransferase family 1 protein, partial [Methanospirillum sp.]|nr:glycosyltransferase family 1 protein [Methanospirillum sp.]
IYDISFITHPQYHTDINRNHCVKATNDAIKYADTIITLSKHGKSELLSHFSIDKDRIQITPLAAHDTFKPINNTQWCLEKYHIPPDYILFIGTLEPRKNLKTLLVSYLALPLEIKEKHNLVIAGGEGWLHNEIDQLIKRNQKHIRYLGYVPEQDLPSLYSGALFFVYPSYYEGFGLPILEAMACGTPVITSDVSSMPEITGDAAILCNPHDYLEFSNKLLMLINDEGLRSELSKKGVIRAAQYSWEDTAIKTLKIYKDTNNSISR